MTVRDLETLFDYSYWANRKIFSVISQLTPEQFVQPVAGSYGSIRNTMVHMLSRCGGASRGDALKGDDFPTVDSLLSTWGKIENHVREFLAGLKDDDLARKVEFTLPPGQKQSMPLGELMHHAAIHGVHHRGQVTLLLRLLGLTPGNVDILFYYAAV